MLRSSITIAALITACAGSEFAAAGECAETQSVADTNHGMDPKKNADAEKPQDIVDTAVKAGSFKILANALAEAELVDALKEDGPFTVFAPTDEAFEKLPKGTLEAVLNDKDKLVAILKYHVVAGKVTSKDVVTLEEAQTLLEGARLKIDTTDGVRINNAKVEKVDIECSNGVIHVIDTVLIPE